MGEIKISYLFYINIFEMFFFINFYFIVFLFFNTSNINYKFFLLVILTLIISSVGMFYGLDGIIMLFLINELTLLLVFVLVFSQINTYKLKFKNNINYFYFTLILLNYFNTDIIIPKYNNFYSWYNIVLNDFYYIYNFFFEKNITITILLLLILTIFSLFFIILFHKIKLINNKELKNYKNITLLRKQNILSQNSYKSNLRFYNV